MHQEGGFCAFLSLEIFACGCYKQWNWNNKLGWILFKWNVSQENIYWSIWTLILIIWRHSYFLIPIVVLCFLDAIASVSALHCSGSVSESVIHSFRCDAIASLSFASLFLWETCLVSAENLRTMFEMWQFANICQLSFPIWEGTEVEQVSLNSLKIVSIFWKLFLWLKL